MGTNWLDKHFLPSSDQAIKDADRALHDFALRVHLHHWHPISTAPFNQDLELHIAEGEAILTQEFPCRRTNVGDWINADLGTRVEIHPVEWRVWQHGPQPYHS